jgi:AraC-like DNA-binding protein
VQICATPPRPLLDIVAHLPPPLLGHLRSLVAREHPLVAAEGWGSFDLLVRRTAADVAVVDPAADGTARVAEIVELIRRHPSLPVVVYTTLTAQALRAIVEMAKQGVHQVVLYRFDDEPARFRELLEQQPGLALSAALLERLSVPLSALPTALTRAMERMFQRPGQFNIADDLATAAGMPRRTLYRTLEGAGLASPSTMVRGARLLRAYSYLRDAGHSAEDVAAKLGYSSRQIFARHVREFFGVRPTQLRREVQEGECVRRLAAVLYTGAAAAGNGRPGGWRESAAGEDPAKE